MLGYRRKSYMQNPLTGTVVTTALEARVCGELFTSTPVLLSNQQIQTLLPGYNFPYSADKYSDCEQAV